MPVPTVITDLSTTAASNFPAGSDAPSTIDDTLRAHGAFIRQIYDGPLIPAYGSAGAPAYGFTSDPNTGWYGEGSDVLSAATGGTKRVSIGAAGNVTISAPGSGIAVTTTGVSGTHIAKWNGAAAADATMFLSAVAGQAAIFRIGGNALDVGGLDLQQDSSGNVDIVNRSNTRLSLYTNEVERVRIDGSGNTITTLQASAPALTANSHMVFSLTSDTNLRVSVRGSDGVTRVANLTLA
jgi:hypothetical protein